MIILRIHNLPRKVALILFITPASVNGFPAVIALCHLVVPAVDVNTSPVLANVPLLCSAEIGSDMFLLVRTVDGLMKVSPVGQSSENPVAVVLISVLLTGRPGQRLDIHGDYVGQFP